MTFDNRPTLPAWHARSFYATLLMIAATVANAQGFDYLAFLGDAGFAACETGGDEACHSQVIDTIELVMPLAFGIWAWAERQAPKFVLVWRRLT